MGFGPAQGAASVSVSSTAFPLRGTAGSVGAPSYSFGSHTNSGLWDDGSGNLQLSVGGTIALGVYQSIIQASSTGVFGFSSGSVGSATDTNLSRFGAGVVGLSNGVNATQYQVYNTTDSTTSPTNYERAWFGYSGNTCFILNQHGGTGVARDLAVQSDHNFQINVNGGTQVLNVDSTGQMKWIAGLGGIVQIAGPTDQQFTFRSSSTQHMAIGTSDTAGNLYFQANNTSYWLVAGNTGNLLAQTDNTNDIGATGVGRPRDLYLGGSIKQGTIDASVASGPQVKLNASVTSPGNPAGATSATDVMAGLAISFVPRSTGRLLVIVQCNAANATAAKDSSVGIRFGTGTAPTNGTAVTGTLLGSNSVVFSSTAGGSVAANLSVLKTTGFSAGTTYWFDLAFSGPLGGAVTITAINYVIIEV